MQNPYVVGKVYVIHGQKRKVLGVNPLETTLAEQASVRKRKPKTKSTEVVSRAEKKENERG